MHTRTILSAHSPVYADPQNKTVWLKIVFEEIKHLGELNFLAVPDDIEPHGRAILASALAGQFGPIAPYVPPVAPAQS